MKYVLDASAVLAVIKEEAGSEKVFSVLSNAVINPVNYAEVVSKLSEWSGTPADALLAVDCLKLEHTDFTQEMAATAGLLRASTKSAGLSLGVRACLATAQHLGKIALTADKLWADVGLDIKIEVIR